MVLTIKNFESQNVGPGVVETAPTNLVGVAGTLKATLTWTSATGESGVTWTEEKLVRKEGSAPQGSMDGTTVATITTKDTYSSTGYEDTGLDSTKTYYYKVFAIYDNGTERGSTDVNVTPTGAMSSPGIYWNPLQKIISLSTDGTNWITIADKNLGATSTDVESYNSFGNYYSRGATQDRNGQAATGYTMQEDWSLGNQSIMPSGYHIPTQDEWAAVIDAIQTLTGFTTLNYSHTKKYLLLPRSGQMLDSATEPSYIGDEGGGYYWTSSKSTTTSALLLRNASTVTTTGSAIIFPRGLTIRAFKDTGVAPDENWMVLYQDTQLSTMTVVRQEKSKSEDFFLRYEDAAGNLLPGSSKFEDFFGIRPVLLNTSGQVVTELNPNNFGQDKDGNTVNIKSGHNVMIEFPARGIKMSKTGRTIRMSITKELNKDGYQYYAHQTGTISEPGEIKPYLYIGAYMGYNNSGTLKSRSGKSRTENQPMGTFCTQAKANGSGYNITSFYGYQYIQALQMMKYGRPTYRTDVGFGRISGDKANTGATNTKGMTGATSKANTGRIKLFGLEDWRGNGGEFIGGVYSYYNEQLIVQLSGYTGAVRVGEGIGVAPTRNYLIESIHGNNKGMFIANGGGNFENGTWSSSTSDYYLSSTRNVTDNTTQYSRSWGAFGLDTAIPNTGFSGTGARLMYMEGLS